MSESQPLERADGIARDIRDFILETFPAARKNPPGDDDALLEGGIVDSLGILELVNFLTEKFGVAITDEDLQPENFNSIRSLVAFVQGRT